MKKEQELPVAAHLILANQAQKPWPTFSASWSYTLGGFFSFFYLTICFICFSLRFLEKRTRQMFTSKYATSSRSHAVMAGNWAWGASRGLMAEELLERVMARIDGVG